MLTADTPPGPPTASLSAEELLEKIDKLAHRLERERARRLAAEALGEEVTANLFETVEQLRSAQGELVERAEKARLANDLARALHQQDDTAALLSLASRSLMTALMLDDCDIVLSPPAQAALAVATKTPGGSMAGAPTTLDHVWSDPTEIAERWPSDLLVSDRGTPLVIHAADAGAVSQPLEHEAEDRDAWHPDQAGTVAVIPVVSTERRAWIVAQASSPWRQVDLDLCHSLARDLAAALTQTRAFAQQREGLRRLEELDHAKDVFLSTVSHELRTPLTSIRGYIEMLEEGELGALSPAVAEATSVISRNVSRLRALVEDLLTMSAVDSAASEQRLALRFDDLVAECHQALLPAYTSRSLSVEIDLAMCWVRADPHQLERAVFNLLNNAVKFNRDGGHITVRLHEIDGVARLAVADTGIGIPATETQHVFGRFYRASAAVDQHIQGTGLGLTLVHNVATSHHGSIELTSVEGEGSTFTLHIPTAATPSPEG